MTPIHPGEHLKEDFMAPLGLSANKLARAIDGALQSTSAVSATVAIAIPR